MLQPVIPFGRVFPDYPVDAPTDAEQRAALAAYFQGAPPQFEECGCCCALHPAAFAGDCREDLLRLQPDTLDSIYGPTGWSETENH